MDPSLLLFIFFTLPLQLTWSSTIKPELEGLKAVHLVFRHGDRTPIDPYPNDPWKDRSHWPVGFGQLTSKGKLQQFKLGEWIRKRYLGFLADNYSEDEVYVRSTDVDRTLMSASANLAGLFPPKGYLKFKTDLEWQPIPIHTVPQREDDLLSSHAHCPRFDELLIEVANSQEMKDIYSENKELFQYISLNAGINLTDIVHLDYIFDTLLVESIYNLTLPEWTEKVFPGKKFEELRDLSFTVDTFTPELRRLKGGPFLQKLVDHFEDIKEEGDGYNGTKLFMYSGHDTTVAPILHTLGVFNGLAPPYASMIIVELFDRGGLHVKLSYKNTTDTAYDLAIPGCQLFCPFEDFKVLTANKRPADWRKECGLPAFADPVVQRVTLLASLASSAMAFTVLLAVVAMLCRGRNSTSSMTTRYQPVVQTEDF